MFFELLHTKPCRTIWKLHQKVSFGSETCEIWQKVGIWTCPDLPRPVQEDKSLSAKRVFLLSFLEITPFQCLLANFSFSIKSYLISSKFVIFTHSIHKFLHLSLIPPHKNHPARRSVRSTHGYYILQCWRRLFLGFRYISAFSAWVHPL